MYLLMDNSLFSYEPASGDAGVMIFDSTVHHDFAAGEAKGVDLTTYRKAKWRGRKVSEAKWISEAAMWTPWVHLGTMRSVNTSEILAIDCSLFQGITLKHRQVSPGCTRYGRAFVDSLNSLAERAASEGFPLTDVPGEWDVEGSEHEEESELRARALAAFEKERLRRKISGSCVLDVPPESPSSRRSRLVREISATTIEEGPAEDPGASGPKVAWKREDQAA